MMGIGGDGVVFQMVELQMVSMRRTHCQPWIRGSLSPDIKRRGARINSGKKEKNSKRHS